MSGRAGRWISRDGTGNDSGDDEVKAGSPESMCVETLLCSKSMEKSMSEREVGDFKQLRGLLIEFLIKKIDSSNAIIMWDLADRSGSKALADASFLYIQRNFPVILSSSDGLWDLPFKYFLRLLKSANLAVSSENDAIESIFHWTSIDDLRRSEPEVITYRSLSSQLERLRQEVLPSLKDHERSEYLSLQDQIRDCEEKEQLLDQSLEALDRLQKSLSSLQQKLVEAAEELAAARRQLPKPKMMKLRYFNMEPPNLIRRIMCAVAVLLNIEGEMERYSFLPPPGRQAPRTVQRELSMEQALALYNDPDLPKLLKDLDPSLLSREQFDLFAHVASNRNFSVHMIERRLGESKKEIPTLLTTWLLSVRTVVQLRIEEEKTEKLIVKQEEQVKEREQSLCDSQDRKRRTASRYGKVEEELLKVTAMEAQLDIDHKLSYMRLVQSNNVTLRRFSTLLRAVRWVTVPQDFVEFFVLKHPLVKRFEGRSEIVAILQHAREDARALLLSSSGHHKQAHAGRLVRASLASHLDAEIAAVLARQTRMRKGLESRRKQHRLTWRSSSFIRELNCQGEDGGFLGCTEKGSSAVLCRHGAREAAIYLFGGLDLQGRAHAFVRRFVPTSWGGHWELCNPMQHARAFSTAAVLQSEELEGGSGGAGAGFVQRFLVCCGISEESECLSSAEVLQVKLEDQGNVTLEQELLRKGHWSFIGSVQQARYLASSFLLSKSVYIIGGFKSNRDPVMTIERLRPSFASFWLRSITDFTRHAAPWKTISKEEQEEEQEEEENVIPAHQRAHQRSEQDSPTTSSFTRASPSSSRLVLFSSYERKADALVLSPKTFRTGAQTAREPIMSGGWGGDGGSQQWWRNRDRCWSGRFRASPPQRIKPFLQPEALQRQALHLKTAHVKTWDSFQPHAVSSSSSSSMFPSLSLNSPPSSPLRRVDQEPPKPVVDHWTAWKRKELARRELVKTRKKEERRRALQEDSQENDEREEENPRDSKQKERDSFVKSNKQGAGAGEEGPKALSIASPNVFDDKFHYRVLAAKRLQCLYRGHLARSLRSKAEQELSSIYRSVNQEQEGSVPASSFYKRLSRTVQDQELLALLKESFRAYGPAGALAIGVKEKDFLRMALSDTIRLRSSTASSEHLRVK
ncbi:hypothetical protein GUITHDRAFT_135636 [Guillardia theta CCMP2712]|uniref:BACK domain-containing protein n=1 Tax=Guillardia theta (strain CCMP2712) TaxID=905079 RepID=L1JP27_GUITC|nr:hypothetical protein GUITHDRAFT_135636 [Guillardia theta CCMP2712]EKX49950.1 hypothetical protein GUITHDRAFT_135636 [Guillardia theta CCMP2712]|eukprot:XP_005836930.1 hypothetical protein GUITHDRAFT_135636 [Guillardia theta CCMP2712]